MSVPFQPDPKKFFALAACTVDGRPSLELLRLNGMLPWD